MITGISQGGVRTETDKTLEVSSKYATIVLLAWPSG